MIVHFEKIYDLSTNMVGFYSLKLGNNDLSEFELFADKDFPDHEDEIDLVYSIIEEMRIRGAQIKFFKTNEGAANALPRVSQAIMDANKEDFGIRLYCIRLTDELVILLNGGIKTQYKPEDCDNVRVFFKQAIGIAARLDKMLFAGEINYQNPECLDELEIEI